MNLHVETSLNRKTGPVSATYAPRQTCPTDCRFLRAGCYAESYPCRYHFERISRQAEGKSPLEIARHEAQGITSMSGRYPLRLHVSGDCADTQSAREIATACAVYHSKHGCPVWAYTHAWRDIPCDAWGPISILASCESIIDAKIAVNNGYCAAIVLSDPIERRIRIGDLQVIPCLEQAKGTPCVSCRLCFNADRLRKNGKIIAFFPHGGAAKLARRAIVDA